MSPRTRTLYICHAIHENDRTFGRNLSDYFNHAGVASKIIEINHDGQRPELRECLRRNAIGVIGFNEQLDHSWIGSTSFMDAAAARGVPVLQWSLDHPSAHLNNYNASTAANSRFLFSSQNAEAYFNRYGIPGALTSSVACVGPSRYSRARELTRQSFSERPILAMVAMNLRRLGGTIEEAWAHVDGQEPRLAAALKEAVDAAYGDIINPLEVHLDRALDNAGLTITNAQRHGCMQDLEDIVQIKRRQYIFSVAREFPVLIQSDAASRPLQAGSRARFEENVGMELSWSRLQQCRAHVSISNMHDMVHDRILNGLNAGCLNIVEDSFANRRALQDGRNALFYRYSDDSLRKCLELVCNDVERAYAIAAEGFTLRDRSPFRFGNFENILALAERRVSYKMTSAVFDRLG